LLVVLAGGPIVYGVQIEDGTLLLAYLLHKISKNGLEVRKLQPLKVRGLFLKKLSIEQLITLIILCSEMLKFSKMTCFQGKNKFRRKI
jgi:hypothetical protein